MTTIPRIYSPPSPASKFIAPPPGPATPAKPAIADAPYLAKLMTMFPAEAVTVYTLGAKSSADQILVVVVTLAALLLVRWAAFRSSGGHTNLLALIVSGVSFLLWVGASGDARLWAELNHWGFTAIQPLMENSSAFLIVVWTWVMPAFVKLTPS